MSGSAPYACMTLQQRLCWCPSNVGASTCIEAVPYALSEWGARCSWDEPDEDEPKTEIANFQRMLCMSRPPRQSSLKLCFIEAETAPTALSVSVQRHNQHGSTEGAARRSPALKTPPKDTVWAPMGPQVKLTCPASRIAVLQRSAAALRRERVEVRYLPALCAPPLLLRDCGCTSSRMP